MRSKDLELLEAEVRRRGLSPNVRNAIRNARIAVVDDRIDDLRSMLDALRREGFTNLIEMQRVESIHSLLAERFDLLILDLVGIATDLAEGDGVGVLSAIKRVDPAIPVLVVSGNTVTPDLASRLTEADLIRTKPILPADLAQDVEALLKLRKDEYWAGLTILRELHRLAPEIAERLDWKERLALWWNVRRLARQIGAHDPHVVQRLVQISDNVSRIGAIGLRIVKIGTAFSPSP